MNFKNSLKLDNILKGLLAMFFVIYLIVLFKIILFKGISISKLFGDYPKLRSINLIPFNTVLDYFSLSKEMGYLRPLSNVAGNLIVFIPFGYLLPTLINKFVEFRKILIAVMGLSLFFEAAQYILGLGSSDIDDFILNTTGGICGYLLYSFLDKRVEKSKVFLAIMTAITVFMFIGGYTVAKKEFGLYLGITELVEVVNGGEDIPKRPPDIDGLFIEGNRSSITVNKLKIEEEKKNNGMVVEANGNEQGNDDFVKTKVLINNSTKIYSSKGSLKDNKLTITYNNFPHENIVKIPKGTTIFIWGEFKDSQFVAKFMMVNLQENQEINNNINHNSNNSNKVKERNNEVSSNGNDITLPNLDPIIVGNIKKINGDEITILKTVTFKENNSMSMGGTKIEAKIKITKNTTFIIRNSYNNGRKYVDKVGNRDDIKLKSLISVWGKKNGNYLFADLILIYIFN